MLSVLISISGMIGFSVSGQVSWNSVNIILNLIIYFTLWETEMYTASAELSVYIDCLLVHQHTGAWFIVIKMQVVNRLVSSQLAQYAPVYDMGGPDDVLERG